MKKLIVAISVMIIGISAFAVELDIEKAINMAQENNYESKNAQKDLENSRLQVKEAYKEGLPKLSYSGIFTKFEEYTDSKGSHDGYYNNKISLTQPIFLGGLVVTGVKVSGIAEERYKYNLENIKNKVRLDIIDSYATIIKLQRTLEVSENSLKVLKKNYEELEVKYSLKMVTKSVLLEMEYSVIELETTIIQIKNSIEIAKQDLRNKTGIAGREPLELISMGIMDVNRGEINLEEDIAYAKENNLNIKMMKIGTRLQKASETIDRAALLPKVNFQFDYGKEDENLSKSVNLGEWGWSATVAVNYDIWYWGKNKNKYDRTKNETAKTIETEKNAVNNIELSIRNNYLELIRIENTIEGKKKAVESSKENFEIESARMQNALITSTDFLASENRYRKAEIEYNNMKIDYYVTYQKYKDLIGRGRK
jgi:outer membrane protein